MRKIGAFLAAAAAAYLLWIFVFPLFRSEESKIRGVIEKTAERTRKKNMFLFAEYFDKNYRDDSGLDADGIRYIGMRVFQMYPVIDLKYDIQGLEIDEKKNSARIELDLFILVTEKGESLDLIHGARKTNSFALLMQKKEGKWLFTESRKP